eukprot:TRINITY_DN5077_c0_g1_i2.p1 TRINITY_DN5077_c0_g1~~TRINITY_DN5077_c0_g1_i2.p1  ORF type:complete len:699 (+),score=72.65 TRINITY_DN5077_c0_g1_i2:121-2217(+)
MSRLCTLLRTKPTPAAGIIVRCFSAKNETDTHFIRSSGVTLSDLHVLALSFSSINCMKDSEFRGVIDKRTSSAARAWSGYRLRMITEIIGSYASSRIAACPLIQDDDLIKASIQNPELMLLATIVKYAGQLNTRVPPSILQYFRNMNFDRIKISSLVKIIEATTRCIAICTVGLRELSQPHKIRIVKVPDLLKVLRSIVAILKQNNIQVPGSGEKPNRAFSLLSLSSSSFYTTTTLSRFVEEPHHPIQLVLILSIICQLYSIRLIKYTNELHSIIVSLFRYLFKSVQLKELQSSEKASLVHSIGLLSKEKPIFYSKTAGLLVERLPEVVTSKEYSLKERARVTSGFLKAKPDVPKQMLWKSLTLPNHSSLIGVTPGSVSSLLESIQNASTFQSSSNTKERATLLLKAISSKQALSTSTPLSVSLLCSHLKHSVFKDVPPEVVKGLLTAIVVHRSDIFNHSGESYVLAAATIINTCVTFKMNIEPPQRRVTSVTSLDMRVELDRLATNVSNAAINRSIAKAVPVLLSAYATARWQGRDILLKLGGTAKNHLKDYSWKEVGNMCDSCAKLRAAGRMLPYKVYKKVISSNTQGIPPKTLSSLIKVSLSLSPSEGSRLLTHLMPAVVSHLSEITLNQLLVVVEASARLQNRAYLPSLSAACCLCVDSCEPYQHIALSKNLKILKCNTEFDAAVRRSRSKKKK